MNKLNWKRLRHTTVKTFFLVTSQLNAQILVYNKFIKCLYMFRALCVHHQEFKLCYTASVSSHTVSGCPAHMLVILTGNINQCETYLVVLIGNINRCETYLVILTGNINQCDTYLVVLIGNIKRCHTYLLILTGNINQRETYLVVLISNINRRETHLVILTGNINQRDIFGDSD